MVVVLKEGHATSEVGSARLLSRPAGRFQGAQAGHLRRRAALFPLRQGAQAAAEAALPGGGLRWRPYRPTASRWATICWASGPPLVLIAGLGYDRWMWHKMVPLLARRHRVLAYDNRGVGETDKPAAAYSADLLAADLAALLDALRHARRGHHGPLHGRLRGPGLCPGLPAAGHAADSLGHQLRRPDPHSCNPGSAGGADRHPERSHHPPAARHRDFHRTRLRRRPTRR